MHGNWELNKDKLFNAWGNNKNEISDKKVIKDENHFFTLNNHNVHNLPINNNHVMPSHNHILPLHNNSNTIPLLSNNAIPLKKNYTVP